MSSDFFFVPCFEIYKLLLLDDFDFAELPTQLEYEYSIGRFVLFCFAPTSAGFTGGLEGLLPASRQVTVPESIHFCEHLVK